MLAKKPAVSHGMILILGLVLLIGGVAGYGGSLYNDLQMYDEAVASNWSGVLNMYRRRADLLPNVIASVQTYAAHESALLTELADARATLIQGLNADSKAPQSLQRFQQAQQKFSSGMGHLLAIAERYPELKADTLFHELIVELEGSENRIAYARDRYIGAVANYNLAVRRFPSNLVAQACDFERRPNLDEPDVENIKRPPLVKAP